MKILIVILLIFIAVLINYLMNLHNIYNYYLLKINKSNEKVTNLLTEKYNLMINLIDALKDEKKFKTEDYNDFITLPNYENIFLDNQIKVYEQKLNEYFEDHEKVLKKNEISDLYKNIKTISNQLRAAKRYYNDTNNKYIKLVSRFPSNLIAKFKHYETNELYEEEVLEQLKILEEE